MQRPTNSPGRLTVKHYSDAPHQAQIESDHRHLAGHWVDIYVDFSGFFGSYGPHMFAAAPELMAYALCEDARSRGEDLAETVLIRHGFDPRECTAQEFMDRMRRAALAHATGSAA
ncbi:hypothetical protein [Variovorax sp.]|uniref:hypothetical protein n=1 Tax=Variovorax sp. TaxID=1871043 RepID=UPI0040377DAD